MAILPIYLLDAPVLRERATEAPLELGVPASLTDLAASMFETMQAARGIGLAAPQVGVGVRLLVAAVQRERVALVNPRVVARSGRAAAPEGCLSVPSLTGMVERATRVTVAGYDVAGSPVTVEASGLFARCLLHEIDHLDGTLFVDRLAELPRKRLTAQWAGVRRRVYGDSAVRHLSLALAV
jgi:peptide deformylase